MGEQSQTPIGAAISVMDKAMERIASDDRIITNLRSDLLRRNHLISELVAAIKPFADAADDLDEYHGDHAHIWESPAAMSILAVDLRRAHAVYIKAES